MSICPAPRSTWPSAFSLFRRYPPRGRHRILRAAAEDIFLWSLWHLVEVPNALRQFTRTEPPALREADARRIIHRLELDVRQGYFLHIEKDWRDVLRAACDISARHAFTFPCRAADLLHVAYAKEIKADLFISFDDDQVKLAKAAGLKTLRPV